MKYLLLVAFVLVGSQVKAQYLLGLNEDGVRNNAKKLGNNAELSFNKKWFGDKFYTLNWYDDQIECKVMVSFNKYTNLSVVTTFTPVDNEVEQAIIQSFEEEGAKKWKEGWILRSGDKVIKIEGVKVREERSLVFREISPNEEF